jgi:hypothetical protein
MTTATTNKQTLFSLEDLSGEAQHDFMEEVGTLVFQSALMRYLQGTDESKSDDFEKFVESHVGSESFMDELCTAYPDFEEILKNEMQAFVEEAQTLTV